jgi:NAD+ diphosphatase
LVCTFLPDFLRQTKYSIDARWFTRAEVAAVLEHQNGLFRSAEQKKVNEESQHLDPTQDRNAPKSDDPPFKLPPTTAIAGVLIKDWVDGKIGFPPNSLRKGNL